MALKAMDAAPGGTTSRSVLGKVTDRISNAAAEAKAQQSNQRPSTGGGGGYGSGGSASGYGEATSNSYMDYLGALQAQRDALIAQANAALDEQGRLAENRYALQKEASDQDYQDLRNQSEVNRYKARGTLRQSLADRGAMDSGIGRQAYVSLANNYDNALNKIGLQQKREDAEREQAKNEMWANIAMQKIANQMSGLDMWGNVLSQLDPSMFQSSIGGAYGGGGGYSYNPTTSDYYEAAKRSVAPFSKAGLTSSIGNAQPVIDASSAARAQAMWDDITNKYNPYNDPFKW